MEAEDIKKMAARLSCSESDVSLALKAAKSDVAEAEKLLLKNIHIVKGCYSAKTNRLHGGIIFMFDMADKKIRRARAIASYDSYLGAIPLNQPWNQIEEKIFDAELKQNVVPAISRDLAAEIEFSLQESLDDTAALITRANMDEIGTRLRRIVCQCLGDADVEMNCEMEKMTKLALKIHDKEISPDGADGTAVPAGAAAAGEGAAAGTGTATGMTGESTGISLILKTDVILSPVTGVPVTSINPGDLILLKITDQRPQAAYIANLLKANEGGRMLPVRVPVRKIDRSESNRLVITTEFGPGVFGRTVVQEGLKIKVVADDTPAAEKVKLPVMQMILIFGTAFLVLVLLLFAVYNFIAL